MMATKDFPYAPFDMKGMMPEMPWTGFDMTGYAEMQRKNVEAVQEAARAAMAGWQAILRRQTEMMQEGMDEFAAAARAMTVNGTPEEGARRQGELLQRSFEETTSNVRELVELASKSNQEVFEVLNRRFAEGMDEARNLSQPAPAKPAAKGKAAA